jgi:hypothetical protein
MPRDGVGQPRAQHHKLMLPFGFRRTHGPADGIIQTPQLALGAAIHIPHANDHGMRLIVEVQAVGDQLLQFDIGREAIKGPATAAGTAFMTSFMTGSTFTAAGSTIRTPLAARTSTRTAAIPATLAWGTRRTIATRLARFAAVAMLGDERFLLLRVAPGGVRFRLGFGNLQRLGQGWFLRRSFRTSLGWRGFDCG